MTAISEKPLPFALNVTSIMESKAIAAGNVAKRLINPICLKGLGETSDSARYQNCLRQLRLETASSTLLRQLAKVLQCPTLVVDPMNIQGGFIASDAPLQPHPAIDLQPACCIDFILADDLALNGVTLSLGDALLRNLNHPFSDSNIAEGSIYRSVFYQPVPILTAEQIAQLTQ